jgi:hypothetical protein
VKPWLFLHGLKDQWCTDTSNAGALNSAFKLYKRAFEIDPPDYYPGINAASLALLRHDHTTAHRLASQVLKICKRKLAVPDPNEVYWLRVTLAEALVILRRRADAKKAYRSAAATPGVAGCTNARITGTVIQLLSVNGCSHPRIAFKVQ